MKVAIFAVLACTLALASAMPEPGKTNNKVSEMAKDTLFKAMTLERDGCLDCVGDIMQAVADCGSIVDGSDIFQCIQDALGAAKDCVDCICKVLAIIGVEGVEQCGTH